MKKRELTIFKTGDREERLEVVTAGGTAWMTQSQMMELFGRDQAAVSRNIANILREKEIEREGNLYSIRDAVYDKYVTYYSLNVLISVGFRISSMQGTKFRIWAAKVLKAHIMESMNSN